MKRLGEILYGDKAPEAQASLWLKRVEPFTAIPHIIDNKKWKSIKIIDSQDVVDDPVMFIRSDTKIPSLSSFVHSDKQATKQSIIETNSDKVYFYLAISTKDRLNKVITEYGENITDDFLKIETGIINFNNNIEKEYNLYEFKINNSFVPLEASIKIIINNENN